MSDIAQETPLKSPLWQARLDEGRSREYVSRLLDPPVSAKTVERWERGITPVPHFRLRQLAPLYHAAIETLTTPPEKAAA